MIVSILFSDWTSDSKGVLLTFPFFCCFGIFSDSWHGVGYLPVSSIVMEYRENMCGSKRSVMTPSFIFFS